MNNLQWAKNKIAAKVQSVVLVTSLAALLGLMGWLLGGGQLALILIGSVVILYFFGPMVPRLPQASWLRTHPPTKERIRRLLEVRDYDQLPQNYPYKFKRNQQSPIYRVAIDSF